MALHRGCLKQTKMPFCRHLKIMPRKNQNTCSILCIGRPIHLYSVGFVNTGKKTATEFIVVCIIVDDNIKKLIDSWNMSTWVWQHFFNRGIWKWLVYVDNGRQPCIHIQSNLIKCMVVAALKFVHNFSVRQSKFSFRQTLLHLHIFEATVSDSLSHFFRLI